MEARLKQNKICLHLLQKSPFSCNLQPLLWKGDVKPHVEPPERPARPHAGQGHGCFTHTKLRPNPAADLCPPPGHQMEPRTGWGEPPAPPHGAPRPKPPGAGRRRSAEPQRAAAGFSEAISLTRPRCSRLPLRGSGSACGEPGGEAPRPEPRRGRGAGLGAAAPHCLRYRQRSSSASPSSAPSHHCGSADGSSVTSLFLPPCFDPAVLIVQANPTLPALAACQDCY